MTQLSAYASNQPSNYNPKAKIVHYFDPKTYKLKSKYLRYFVDYKTAQDSLLESNTCITQTNACLPFPETKSDWNLVPETDYLHFLKNSDLQTSDKFTKVELLNLKSEESPEKQKVTPAETKINSEDDKWVETNVVENRTDDASNKIKILETIHVLSNPDDAQIQIKITARNFLNQTKTYGGDYFIARFF